MGSIFYLRGGVSRRCRADQVVCFWTVDPEVAAAAQADPESRRIFPQSRPTRRTSATCPSTLCKET